MKHSQSSTPKALCVFWPLDLTWSDIIWCLAKWPHVSSTIVSTTGYKHKNPTYVPLQLWYSPTLSFTNKSLYASHADSAGFLVSDINNALGYQFSGLDGLTAVPLNRLVGSMCSCLTWTPSIQLLRSTALIVAPWAIYLNLLKEFYQIWQSGDWRMAVASILNTAVQILILERLMCFPILMLQLSVISLDVYQLIPTVGL